MTSSLAGATLASNGVSCCQLIVVVLIESVDISGGELASGHLFGEEDIEFVESTVFGLGYVSCQQVFRIVFLTTLLTESEVSPDEDAPGAESPDKASIALEIPCLRVHEVIFEGSANDTGDVAGVTR